MKSEVEKVFVLDEGNRVGTTKCGPDIALPALRGGYGWFTAAFVIFHPSHEDSSLLGCYSRIGLMLFLTLFDE